MAIYKEIKLNQDFEKLPHKKLFVVSFIASILTIILGLLAQIILPPEIPLFYGLPQTSEQIARSILIILPSIIAIFISLINVVLAIQLDDSFLKKVLAFTSISITFLAIITTYKIIFLVGII